MRATHQTERYQIALICGGDSAEREISLVSGKHAAAALQSIGHRVEVFDLVDVTQGVVHWPRFDVCFLALHGGDGENGRLQKLLESVGIPYTGSGPEASRLAMSKSAAKARFRECGVSTLPHRLLHYLDLNRQDLAASGLDLPVVVKPDSQGSSLGVGFCAGWTEYEACLDRAFALGPYVLVEPWIGGREFTVAVMNRTPLPVLEIVTPRALFDYEAKYESKQALHRFETGLSDEVVARIQQLAVAACGALGTTGLARVDVMMDLQGQAYVLEVNTIPGMTPTSLAPRACEAGGIGYEALCDWMVREAISQRVVIWR